VTDISKKRKEEHLDICLNSDIEYERLGPGFIEYDFIHQALPELDLDSIDTSIDFLGKRLALPLMISPITGGTESLAKINCLLAGLASSFGIAMGLGSARIVLEDETSAKYFKVRKTAPDILLFANLGAVQLNYGFNAEHCKRLVDVLEADGIMLHLNPIQEAFQPEGNHDFSGLLKKIGDVCKSCDFPVIVREVGFGISADVAEKLIESGVEIIDISGSGGTSWVRIESSRSEDEIIKDVSDSFKDWGIPTAKALVSIREAQKGVRLIASGGIRDGVDVAKAIALGADITGIGLPLLKASAISKKDASDLIKKIATGLRIAMFGIGVPDIESLRKTSHIEKRY